MKKNTLFSYILTVDEIYNLYYSLEIWRPVVGYEGWYEVSDYGRIRSVERKIDNGVHLGATYNGKILSSKRCDNYYKTVALYKEGQSRTMLSHRIVAQAFLENPENKPEVNHINRIKSDNRLENLEWVSSRENKSSRNFIKKKTSKHIGVSRQKNRWVTYININGNPTYLGCFKNELDAANKYKEALEENNLQNKYAANI